LLALSQSALVHCVFIFLVIPVKQAGSVKNYIFLFLSLMIIPAIAYKLFSFMEPGLDRKLQFSLTILWNASSMIPGNTNDQVSYILGNIPNFITVVFKTIFVYRENRTFLNLLGTLAAGYPLPSFLIILFLTMLLITALGDSTYGINPDWKLKAIPLVCFILAVAHNRNGILYQCLSLQRIAVEGVQGDILSLMPQCFSLYSTTGISQANSILHSVWRRWVITAEKQGKIWFTHIHWEDEQFLEDAASDHRLFHGLYPGFYGVHTCPPVL